MKGILKIICLIHAYKICNPLTHQESSFNFDCQFGIYRSYNYEVYLKDIFKYRAATEEKQENPFVNSDFKSLDLRTKVEVLHQLCDYRLDAADVMDQLKVLNIV